MSEKNKKIKILFYTCTARAFRTTLIGHLHEISKKFDVILLSEKLDKDTEKLLNDKEVFPGIYKIIHVDLINTSRLKLFSKNTKYFYKLAEKIFLDEKPDVLITSSDSHSLFEIYLNRLGKRFGAINVVLQATLQMAEDKKISKWFDLINIYTRFSNSTPYFVRSFLVTIRKYFGHIVYYWIFPIYIGEWPFFGRSSYILKTGNSGMRDADYQFIFSGRDYDIWLKDGVSPKKLFILPHPLESETRNFFKRNLFLNSSVGETKNILLVLPDTEIGFDEKNHKLISKTERISEWVDICKTVGKVFPEHEILLKPHPNHGPFMLDFEKAILSLKNRKIVIVPPENPVDQYVEGSDLIIGLPTSASTVLFTAHLQCPEKRIISVDFGKELLGDCYKNFEGIDYVDNRDYFLEILMQIKKDEFKNKHVNINIGKKENEITKILKRIIS